MSLIYFPATPYEDGSHVVVVGLYAVVE